MYLLLGPFISVFMAFVYGYFCISYWYFQYDNEVVVGCSYWLIHRKWFYYSFTKLKHKKNPKMIRFLAFYLCVLCVKALIWSHWPSSASTWSLPLLLILTLLFLTSSWTLGEWDVTHNDAVASDSPADARLSTHAYQWRLIPLYSLHSSRMASLSAGWDDVCCCQSRTRGDVLLLWCQTWRNLQQMTSF